jgi:hypothetical protein
VYIYIYIYREREREIDVCVDKNEKKKVNEQLIIDDHTFDQSKSLAMRSIISSGSTDPLNVFV